MRGFLSLIGLGMGLALGGGMVYVLSTNEALAMAFLMIGMFLLGCTIFGLFAFLLNRQWARSVFGTPGQVTNNYRVIQPTQPLPPIYGNYDPWVWTQQPYYPNDRLPAGNDPVTDDSPVA